jgi:two-component system chemotaxis sensor kinase CheA
MAEFSLDDAVTLLLQLEPEDRDDLARVREQLADLAFGNKVAIAVQPLVARAVRALKPLAEGTALDPAAALAEVGALLEQVVGWSDAPAAAAGGRAVAPGHAAAASPPSLARVAVPAGEAEADATADLLPMDLDLELLKDFIVESRDCISASEAALLALEHTPDDVEAVNTVFRAFHTVKGTSAFLGLARMTAFAHEAESLLMRVREREIAYGRGCADLSLRSVDMLKAELDAVEAALHAGGPGAPLERPDGYDELVTALIAFDGKTPVTPAGPVAAPAPIVTAAAEPVVQAPVVQAPVMQAPVMQAPVMQAPVMQAPVAPAAASAGEDERRQGSERRQADRRQAERRAAAAPNEADQFLRVRTDRLDRLIDMVGELVIAQSMIAGDENLQRLTGGEDGRIATTEAMPAASGQHHELAKKIGHAGKIVRELQDLSMSMRMVPLKATIQKLARLVRDVSAKLGKEVEFVTEGEDTEIDRNMVDIVGDPLVHMVRNALDHGVESPADRVRAGKPRQGRVRVAAYHAGGSVIVELQDDGRGLSREKIARKAIEKGLIDSDKGMSDADVFALIFAPGFSTAEPDHRRLGPRRRHGRREAQHPTRCADASRSEVVLGEGTTSSSGCR